MISTTCETSTPIINFFQLMNKYFPSASNEKTEYERYSIKIRDYNVYDAAEFVQWHHKKKSYL